MTSVLVNIDVDDLERATTFYVNAFGLSVGRRFGTEALELLGAAVPIYLLVKAAGSVPFAAAPETRTYRPHWSPVHLDFVVDDIDAGHARACAAGAIDEGPIGDHSWGRLALMRDPFGHGFCLIEFRGRGYDEIATG